MLYSTEQIRQVSIGDKLSTLYNGDYEVIGEIPREGKKEFRYIIKFLDTGYSKSVTRVEMRRGKIKDRYVPSVFGVGYIGEVRMVDYRKEYSVWSGMLERCYDPNLVRRDHRIYEGVSVCERWKSFENFLEDYPKIARYGVINPDKVALDKDFLQQETPRSERIYSLYTVILTSLEFNSGLTERGWEPHPIIATRGEETLRYDSHLNIDTDIFRKKIILRCLRGSMHSDKIYKTHKGYTFTYDRSVTIDLLN